jgi:hypothetical protein
LTLAEAALAKSLLDDYEIFCALWHENAHLYGRAPFAMPVSLVVADAQADAAVLVLQNDEDLLARYLESYLQEERLDADITQSTWPAEEKQNPWELLVIAYYFCLPAICVLQIGSPALFGSTPYARYVIARVAVAHLLGWLAVAFAVALIVGYVRVRRQSVAKKTGLTCS